MLNQLKRQKVFCDEKHRRNSSIYLANFISLVSQSSLTFSIFDHKHRTRISRMKKMTFVVPVRLRRQLSLCREIDYVQNEKTETFKNHHFTRTMANGEQVHSKWLLYYNSAKGTLKSQHHIHSFEKWKEREKRIMLILQSTESIRASFKIGVETTIVEINPRVKFCLQQLTSTTVSWLFF